MDKRSEIINFLNAVSNGLELLEDDFYLIGSAALVIQGLEPEKVNDIDLLTSTRDAKRLKEFWNDRIQETFVPADGERFRSEFGRFSFEGFDIEVMGNLEVNTLEGWHKLIIEDYSVIDIGHLSLKIPTLREQKRVFNLFGRPKDLHKAQMIKTLY